MAKRSNGEGSVRRRPNGTWEARLYYEDPRTGMRKRRSFYGQTAAEARRQMREARERLAAGAPVADSVMTVQEWCWRWLETTVAASSRRPTTRVLYESLVRSHLSPPPLGQMTLGRVRPSDIEALVLRLRARGLAESTVQRIFIVLRMALEGAVRDGLIARNPAALVRPPRIERTEARRLSLAEVSALLECARGTRYYPLLRLIATTGLRKGEALALAWDAVDLERGEILVRATLTRIEGQLVVSAPKTAQSRRVLPLAPAEVAMLAAHREQQAVELSRVGEWQQDGFVFTTESGEPMDPRNVLRAMTIAAANAGLIGVNVHTLRHSAATAWLEAGVNVKAVSALLGHADIRITADVYGHVSEAVSRAAMVVLSESLREPSRD